MPRSTDMRHDALHILEGITQDVPPSRLSPLDLDALDRLGVLAQWDMSVCHEDLRTLYRIAAYPMPGTNQPREPEQARREVARHRADGAAERGSEGAAARARALALRLHHRD